MTSAEIAEKQRAIREMSAQRRALKQEQTMSDKSLILIDLSNVFWSAWHASESLPVGEAYSRTVAAVRRLVEQHEYAAVCCDAPPYWRKELLPTYKANRDAHEQQALEQLRRVESRLDADGILMWKCQGYEADDIIATACAAADYHGIPRTVVASSDKDLLQLVSDRAGIRCHSMATGQVFDERGVQDKFGVPPAMMRDFLALTGDSGDNIPGIPGVGPKNAAKLLADFKSAAGVLAGCDKIPSEKMRNSVFASGDAVRLGLQLVALKTDAPINFEDVFKKREIKALAEETMQEPEEESGPQERPTEPPSAPEVDAEPVQDVKQPGPKSTAIQKADPSDMATAPSASFEDGLQPGTLKAAYRLAGSIANSRLYPRLPNQDAVFAIIIRGREMGLGALTALDSISIVEGRPAPGAHLLVARAKKHPDCEYFQFIGGDDTYAEYETKNRRNPKPTRLKYTIEQARKAGLIRQRGNWETRPAEMLRKTVAVQLARVEYPEALLGAYAQEELEGAA